MSELVLCSVPDQRVALEEIGRVLRPRGQLRFYEHVISTRPGWSRFQRALDATIYPPLVGGCHCARDTGAAIRRAGFDVEREERVVLKASHSFPRSRTSSASPTALEPSVSPRVTAPRKAQNIASRTA